MSPPSNSLSDRMRRVPSEALKTSYFRLPSKQMNDLSYHTIAYQVFLKNGQYKVGLKEIYEKIGQPIYSKNSIH